MRILNHGNALYFKCENCECEWMAVKKECREKTRYAESIPSGKYYMYDCPECGAETLGKRDQYEKFRG